MKGKKDINSLEGTTMYALARQPDGSFRLVEAVVFSDGSVGVDFGQPARFTGSRTEILSALRWAVDDVAWERYTFLENEPEPASEADLEELHWREK